MTKKDYIIIGLLIGAALIVGYFTLNKSVSLGGTGVVTTTASSTTVTLGQTSLRLLATSTKRFAFSVQPLGCTAVGTTFIQLETPGAGAIAGSGFAILSSTTQIVTDNDLQAPVNAVQAVVDVGTCNVLITEWTTNF